MGQRLAAQIGVRQHGLIEVSSGESCVQLPVIIRQRIADNCIGIYTANEVNGHSLLHMKLALKAVPEDGSVLASSRAMFDQLLIKDALAGGLTS